MGGCHIILATDHLNNILVSSTTELRQPAKVLRWLQEIESVGIRSWCFTPDTSNWFADMASRHPAQRDLLKAKLVERSQLPSTLQEAFQQVVGWFGVGGTAGATLAGDPD